MSERACDNCGQTYVARRSRTRYCSRRCAGVTTNEQVHQIRRLGTTGMKHRDIAAAFGISQVNTSMIIRRATWRHI